MTGPTGNHTRLTITGITGGIVALLVGLQAVGVALDFRTLVLIVVAVVVLAISLMVSDTLRPVRQVKAAKTEEKS